MGSGLLAALPQILQSFAAGQAMRQRDPTALASIIETIAQGMENRRRTQLAEESQKLREQREGRLAEMSGRREERLVTDQERRTANDTAMQGRQARNDLASQENSIYDDARQVFSPRTMAPAAMEEYITQQSSRVGGLEGGNPQNVRAALMSLATMLSQPEPEVPYIERQAGTPPPTSVPRGAVVRNAPTAPQPKEAPLPGRIWSDDPTNPDMQEMVLIDPRSGKEINRTGQKRKRSVAKVDPIDALVNEVLGGGRAGGPAPAPTSKAAAPAGGGPKVGDVVTVQGKKKRITKLYPNGRFDAVDAP